MTPTFMKQPVNDYYPKLEYSRLGILNDTVSIIDILDRPLKWPGQGQPGRSDEVYTGCILSNRCSRGARGSV